MWPVSLLASQYTALQICSRCQHPDELKSSLMALRIHRTSAQQMLLKNLHRLLDMCLPYILLRYGVKFVICGLLSVRSAAADFVLKNRLAGHNRSCWCEVRSLCSCTIQDATLRQSGSDRPVTRRHVPFLTNCELYKETAVDSFHAYSRYFPRVIEKITKSKVAI